MNQAILIIALEQCQYREDVEALEYFVFHPRYNGASNVCVLCLHGAGEKDDGHSASCAFGQAYRRCVNHRLAAWLENR
jgi:hypothetical protein